MKDFIEGWLAAGAALLGIYIGSFHPFGEMFK